WAFCGPDRQDQLRSGPLDSGGPVAHVAIACLAAIQNAPLQKSPARQCQTSTGSNPASNRRLFAYRRFEENPELSPIPKLSRSAQAAYITLDPVARAVKTPLSGRSRVCLRGANGRKAYENRVTGWAH